MSTDTTSATPYPHEGDQAEKERKRQALSDLLAQPYRPSGSIPTEELERTRGIEMIIADRTLRSITESIEQQRNEGRNFDAVSILRTCLERAEKEKRDKYFRDNPEATAGDYQRFLKASEALSPKEQLAKRRREEELRSKLEAGDFQSGDDSE